MGLNIYANSEAHDLPVTCTVCSEAWVLTVDRGYRKIPPFTFSLFLLCLSLSSHLLAHYVPFLPFFWGPAYMAHSGAPLTGDLEVAGSVPVPSSNIL